MKLKPDLIAAAILVPALWISVPTQASARDRVDCASEGGSRNYCPADTRGGVHLVEQYSRATCVEGRSWGYDRGGIWVSDGCRGRFETRRGRGRAPQVQIVTCESRGGATNHCAVDTRGGVRLEERLSRAACDQGHGWGYDRTGIWVNHGCRGRFRVGDGGAPRQAGTSSGSGSADEHFSTRDIVTAAAVIGGAALLASILGGDDGIAPPQAAATVPPDPAPAPYSGTGTGTVPAWAVGQFRGFNSQANSSVELNVYPAGEVIGYVNGQRVDGYYADQRINMSGYWFDLLPEPGGLRTVLEGSGNQVVYRRVQ